MHTNQTSNSLAIDSLAKFPLADDVKAAFADLNFSELYFETLGLPAFNSHFSMAGDQLYFEGNPDGSVALKKSDFTGEILMSGILSKKEVDTAYSVVFRVIFCGGVLLRAELQDFKTQPFKEYEAGYANFCASMEKTSNRKKSFWFRYLYKPYYYFLKWTTIGIVFVIESILRLFVVIMSRLAPIAP